MNDLIYTKFSNERARKYAVRTDIVQGDQGLIVRKRALYPEGEEHIRKIPIWYEKLSAENHCFSYQVCMEKQGYLEFAYADGKTLEEDLDEKISSGHLQEASEKLTEYLQTVYEMCPLAEYRKTPEFVTVFGDIELSGEHKSAAVTDIDMVCSNVILDHEGQPSMILDYEWTFDFPVPVLFVLYRIIFYYVEKDDMREALKEYGLYEKFGISGELRETFAKMEHAFQLYIEDGHVPIRNMYADISPGYFNSPMGTNDFLQVYFSSGDGYREENSVKYPIRNGRVSVDIPLKDKVKFIRLDPGSQPCYVDIRKLIFDDKKEVTDFVTEGGYRSGKRVFIGKPDPNLDGIQVPEGAEVLSVEMEIREDTSETFQEMVKLMVKQEKHLKKAEERIKAMEHTKIWKLYRKYRRFAERKR